MTVGWQEDDRRITRRQLEVDDYSRKVKDDNDKQMNNKRMSGAMMFMQYDMLLLIVRLVSDQTCDHDTLLQVKLLGEELMNN